MDDVGSPLFIRLGNRGRDYTNYAGQEYKADVKPEGVPVGALKNVHISDVTAKVVGDDKAQAAGMLISGIPGHHVENIVLENISISLPGGGTRADAEREVPEDIARYPEQFFFGVLPSWGAYIRHASNIQFKNVKMETRSVDARERIVLNDVEGFADE